MELFLWQLFPTLALKKTFYEQFTKKILQTNKLNLKKSILTAEDLVTETGANQTATLMCGI